MNANISQSGTLKANIKSQGVLKGVISKPLIINAGSQLPTVTEKDDGKVLKVQGGLWSKGSDETAEALTNSEIEAILNGFV